MHLEEWLIGNRLAIDLLKVNGLSMSEAGFSPGTTCSWSGERNREMAIL
jgi:hypothetical protein